MADDIIDRLLRLQDQDLQIVDRESEREALPERIKALDKDLESFRAAIEDADAKRKNAQLAVKQIELEIDTQRQTILRLRGQQMSLKTNREFRAMEDEIGRSEAIIGQLENRLLEAMETVDGLSDDIKARKSELQQAEESVGKQKEAMESRIQAIDADLERLRAKRATAAETIPKPWLPGYERLFNGKRDRVLVAVESGICGGCHMKLPPAVMHSARRSESLVTCDFCGRMLYSAQRMS